MTERELIEQHQKEHIELINLNAAGIETAQSQAGAEAESSKDYIGRVVFEFFQNALDRADSNIWLELTKNSFIISNDGQPFSIFDGKDEHGKKSDFHSLNTIYNGVKIPGESVGNKGVGFKSCWNVCSNVSIESINEKKESWGFELFNPIEKQHYTDNSEISEVLDKTNNKIPSFYFPKYYASNKENFKSDAETKITIKFDKENKEKAYKEIELELKEFQKSKFIFLNQLKDKEDKNYNIHIIIDKKEQHLKSIDDTWTVEPLADKDMHEELIEARGKEKYKNIPQEPNIAISFPPDNMDENIFESNFYTYLPTKAKCGFNVLIHADFALDNARKEIPPNDYNNKIFEIAAKLLVNQLLDNVELHKYKSFAKFLMPNNKNDTFAKSVWKELVLDNKLTKILKKVYTKDANFNEESYEFIFEAISKWNKDKTDRNYGTHYENIYKGSLKYFCNPDVLIVWIDEDNKTFLPSKKENKEYEYNLFYQPKTDKNNSLDYGLLIDVENLKISSFELLKIDLFSHNKIVREFSTLEILRSLKDKESIKVIKFIKQLIDNTAEELSPNVKKQLLELKLPTQNGYVKVKNSYINIDSSISSLFDDTFVEVDKEQFDSIDNLEEFLIKIGVASDRLPCSSVLPFKDDCRFPASNLLKDFIYRSLDFINDDMIEQLRELKWFYDELKNKNHAPSKVFAFKEHDNRKIASIAQEKKKISYNHLYDKFEIYEIEDTSDVKKLVIQLEDMKERHIDTDHQDIYKKITSQISKQHEDITSDIPLLAIDINSNKIMYIKKEDRSKVVFLETKYKQYKEQIKDTYEYIGYFDTNISHKFLKNNVHIEIFNPNYTIKYEDNQGNNIKPTTDEKIKTELQDEFLAPFFALANEILGSSFNKDDAIKRWEYLSIKKAYNIILTIRDKDKPIVISSTKKHDIDVLYIPIKNKDHKPTQIGEVAHDLIDPMNHINLRKFAQIFAEGIFRNQKLKSDFELYITAYKDEAIKSDILINKGVEDSHIEQMKVFIKKNLLDENKKQEIVSTMKGLGITIDAYEDIRKFEIFVNLEMSFDEFKGKFNEEYQSIISNIIDEYKLSIKHKIINNIENRKGYLQVLCFKQKSENYFDEKFEKIKNKSIDSFKIESDIFKCFEVEEIDENLDAFIEAEIDLKYGTDKINEEKLTLEVLNNKLKANDNPNLGSAKQSKSNQEKQHKEQLANQNRGLGQELKISYKYAKDLFANNKLKDSFINTLKNDFDYGVEKEKLNKYIKNLNKDYSKLDFAKKVINIASNKLDGLGYDLIIPGIEGSSVNILKVELKSTVTNKGKIQVHFSKNEISRIKYFSEKDDKSFRIWLNSKENDITDDVHTAISELPKELPFHFEDYILTLGIQK